MKPQSNWQQLLPRDHLWVAGAVLLAGFLVFLPPLERLSYDLPFILRGHTQASTNLLLLYLDSTTFELKGERNNANLSRTNLTQLTRRMTQERAKLLIYDLVLSEKSKIESDDAEFAQAIRDNGRVVLCAGSDGVSSRAGLGVRLHPPLEIFRRAAKAWGHGAFLVQAGADVQRLPRSSNAGSASLSWTAATQLTNSVQAWGAAAEFERWLNYRGRGREAWTEHSLYEALEAGTLPPGYFRDKIVIVGGRRAFSGVQESGNDAFATPWSWLGSHPAPGAEIHATALVDLLESKWLERFHPIWQLLGSFVWGGGLSLVLCQVRRDGLTKTLGAALTGSLMVIVTACLLHWQMGWWGSWIVPAVFQPMVAMVMIGVIMAVNPPSPPKVFISYRSAFDKNAAHRLYDKLYELGCTVYMDKRNLGVGEYEEQLMSNIAAAKFFILIISPKTFERDPHKLDECFVRRELRHALKHGKTLIPMTAGGMPIPTDDIELAKHLPADVIALTKWRGLEWVEYNADNLDAVATHLNEKMRRDPPQFVRLKAWLLPFSRYGRGS